MINDTATFITPVSTESTLQPSSAANVKEFRAKIFKQHMEIGKLKEELECAEADKKELEEEIKQRNEEIYQMNEKMIMLEINSSMTLGGDARIINDIQGRLDRLHDNNVRRVSDLHKLKQCLERLKCDLHVLYLSKKLNKDNSQVYEDRTANTNDEGGEDFTAQDNSADSDRMVSDQIQGTLELIQKLESAL